ncbi:uncharacterized protein N0V89_008830 [Didymosphaeria variabile]|uniref:Uncharacterized protein n=1 Tax=Didymosphaeria variabile TaxID=1932322 RepID=A0A9W9C8Y9_9PLEO|nr:uncharacterized protein N0V89_008830 [Didymosphaeria variabile]KAJ4350209.1 hypothetical protein N0V89_008830 [Didymosphaeria variabile]
MSPYSSRDPTTNAGPYSPSSGSTTNPTVNVGRKRKSEAAEGDSISWPPKTHRKLQTDTTPKAKRKLPILSVEGFDKYVDGKWTVLDWMVNVWDRSTVKQMDILCRLGLVAPGTTVRNNTGIFYFDDPTLTELSKAIHGLSKSFYNESFDQTPAGPLIRGRPRAMQGRKRDDAGRDAFVDAASNPMHMNQQLDDLLFDQFGPKVWGMDVAAREGCTYRLELEDDVDRPKIEALLHLWVFVKIANACRAKRQKLHGSGRKSRAKKDLGNMAGKAPALLSNIHNDTNDDDVDENTSDVAVEDVEGEESQDQETANTVDGDEAGCTIPKEQGDLKATSSMKRKPDTKKITPSVRTEGHDDARATASEDEATVFILSDEQTEAGVPANNEDTSGLAPPKTNRGAAHKYMLAKFITDSGDESHADFPAPKKRRIVNTFETADLIHWKEDSERVAKGEKSVDAGSFDGRSDLAVVPDEQQVVTAAGDDASVDGLALAIVQSSSTALAPIDNSQATTKTKLPDFHTFMKSIHGDLLAKRN